MTEERRERARQRLKRRIGPSPEPDYTRKPECPPHVFMSWNDRMTCVRCGRLGTYNPSTGYYS